MHYRLILLFEIPILFANYIYYFTIFYYAHFFYNIVLILIYFIQIFHVCQSYTFFVCRNNKMCYTADILCFMKATLQLLSNHISLSCLIFPLILIGPASFESKRSKPWVLLKHRRYEVIVVFLHISIIAMIPTSLS